MFYAFILCRALDAYLVCPSQMIFSLILKMVKLREKKILSELHLAILLESYNEDMEMI